jgi:hypothetical protein
MSSADHPGNRPVNPSAVWPEAIAAVAAARPEFARTLAMAERVAPGATLDRGQVLTAIAELAASLLPRQEALLRMARRLNLDWGGASLSLSPEELGLLIDRLVGEAESAGLIPALLAALRRLQPAEAEAIELLRDFYQRSAFAQAAMIGGDDERGAGEAGGAEEAGEEAGSEETGSEEAGSEETEAIRDLPPAEEVRLVDLRLDTAVPRRVFVGKAFRLAVAVRLPTSPPLDKSGLPAVESGDLLIEWPTSARAMRLRFDVDAPDCTIVPPAVESFRLFAGRDGPTLEYLLTPHKQGDIAIVVTVYVEGADEGADEPLGAAGLTTRAEADTADGGAGRGGGATTGASAGAVEVHVQSLSLSKLTDPHVVPPLMALAALLTDLFGFDASLPLTLAQRALLDTTRIERSPVLADQWWLVAVAAHNSARVDALVAEAATQNPGREGDLRSALAAYAVASAIGGASPTPAPPVAPEPEP